MFITPNYLLHVLKQRGIIDDDNSLNVKYYNKLMSAPQLLQYVIDTTSFLYGSVDIKTRLHILKNGIREQPLCKTCKQPVKMRLTGRFRFTFPTFCSNKCSGNDKEVKIKRRHTKSLGQ